MFISVSSNLEKFIFNGNDLRCDINYIDPKNFGVENIIKDFITKSKKLDTLVLSNCKINKNLVQYCYELLNRHK